MNPKRPLLGCGNAPENQSTFAGLFFNPAKSITQSMRHVSMASTDSCGNEIFACLVFTSAGVLEMATQGLL